MEGNYKASIKSFILGCRTAPAVFVCPLTCSMTDNYGYRIFSLAPGLNGKLNNTHTHTHFVLPSDLAPFLQISLCKQTPRPAEHSGRSSGMLVMKNIPACCSFHSRTGRCLDVWSTRSRYKPEWTFLCKCFVGLKAKFTLCALVT